MQFYSLAELDAVLHIYFVNLALDGFDTATGRVTLTSLRYLMPSFVQKTKLLPRSLRALEGWMKLVPPAMRLPLPKLAMLAIVGYLIANSQIMPLALLTGALAFLEQATISDGTASRYRAHGQKFLSWMI